MIHLLVITNFNSSSTKERVKVEVRRGDSYSSILPSSRQWVLPLNKREHRSLRLVYPNIVCILCPVSSVIECKVICPYPERPIGRRD